jgi:hypothetical protein
LAERACAPSARGLPRGCRTYRRLRSTRPPRSANPGRRDLGWPEFGIPAYVSSIYERLTLQLGGCPRTFVHGTLAGHHGSRHPIAQAREPHGTPEASGDQEASLRPGYAKVIASKLRKFIAKGAPSLNAPFDRVRSDGLLEVQLSYMSWSLPKVRPRPCQSCAKRPLLRRERNALQVRLVPELEVRASSEG